MVLTICGKFRFLRILRSARTVSLCKLSTRSVANKRLVYNSSSLNIFSNLAFEEWLYENRDLEDEDILLIWQNSPSIVIGRHQNPWLESNISQAEKGRVIFSRRSSGGGAVYHDEGNLNLSFIKSRDRYDRRENLNLVVDALTSRWDIDVKVNERDDILLDGFYKISGTAAKLGRTKSYHHFTLLHSVDKDRLVSLLNSPMQNAASKSTRSVPALVKNLHEASPSMTIDSMVDVISSTFLGQAQVSERVPIDPTDEEQFPGVTKISDRLQNWDWLYGKTPNFSIERQFSMQSPSSIPISVVISISVTKGCVSSLILTFSENEPHIRELCWQLTNVFERHFPNMQLTSENVKLLLENYTNFAESLIKGSREQELTLWIKQCIDVCFQFL